MDKHNEQMMRARTSGTLLRNELVDGRSDIINIRLEALNKSIYYAHHEDFRNALRYFWAWLELNDGDMVDGATTMMLSGMPSMVPMARTREEEIVVFMKTASDLMGKLTPYRSNNLEEIILQARAIFLAVFTIARLADEIEWEPVAEQKDEEHFASCGCALCRTARAASLCLSYDKRTDTVDPWIELGDLNTRKSKELLLLRVRWLLQERLGSEKSGMLFATVHRTLTAPPHSPNYRTDIPTMNEITEAIPFLLKTRKEAGNAQQHKEPSGALRSFAEVYLALALQAGTHSIPVSTWQEREAQIRGARSNDSTQILEALKELLTAKQL